MVRYKFKCTVKSFLLNGIGSVELIPVASGSEENQNFFKWTPWGKIEIGSINEEALKQFQPGKEYYIDISLAE